MQFSRAQAYRNTYVNLAIPLFAMSEPFPPAQNKLTLGDGKASPSLRLICFFVSNVAEIALLRLKRHFSAAHSNSALFLDRK